MLFRSRQKMGTSSSGSSREPSRRKRRFRGKTLHSRSNEARWLPTTTSPAVCAGFPPSAWETSSPRARRTQGTMARLGGRVERFHQIWSTSLPTPHFNLSFCESFLGHVLDPTWYAPTLLPVHRRNPGHGWGRGFGVFQPGGSRHARQALGSGEIGRAHV